MSILPVAGVTAVAPTLPAFATDATRAAGSPTTSFASVASGIDQLQQSQSTTKELGIAAVTGDLDDVHDYTIAAAQSATQLELTAAVRNKAVEAFQEIMRMTV
jgi:flagellar hook-basal body complex protein FliE